MSPIARAAADSQHPLRRFRDAHRPRPISLRGLERDTGISYITLHHYEHGRTISLKHQIVLADYFKVTVDQLLKGPDGD